MKSVKDIKETLTAMESLKEELLKADVPVADAITRIEGGITQLKWVLGESL